MKPKIVSVFSGVGGIDFGFEKAGFETVFATDIWNKACESLKANFPNSEIVCDTIENIEFKKIKKKYKVIDGLVGGPPCPPFSKSRFYRKEKERGISQPHGTQRRHLSSTPLLSKAVCKSIIENGHKPPSQWGGVLLRTNIISPLGCYSFCYSPKSFTPQGLSLLFVFCIIHYIGIPFWV